MSSSFDSNAANPKRASQPGRRPPRMAVAGAGAIGCTLAATLAQAGLPVSLLARGATLQAAQRDGITLTTATGRACVPISASDKAAELGPQDVVFICTKAQDVATILPSLQPMIGPETLVVPLINGVPWWYFQGIEGQFSGNAIQSVDPDGRLLRLLPINQVLGAVVFITAERTAPATVTSLNPMLIILGELDHTETDRLRWVAEAIGASGIEGRASPRIRDPLWTKIIANLTTNPLSVLTEAPLDALYSDPRLLPLVRQILLEGFTLAAAYGARIQFDPATFVSQAVAMGPVRTSMLQDALHGHPLELSAIGDAVLELADLQGIPMPAARQIVALAHYRNDALGAARQKETTNEHA